MELFSRTVCLNVGPEYVVKPCLNYTVGPPYFNITFPEFPTSPLPTTIATATTPDIRTSTGTGTRGPSPEITTSTTPSPGIPTGTSTRGPPPEETATPSITPQFTPTLSGTPPKNIAIIAALSVVGGIFLLLLIVGLIAFILYYWRKKHHLIGKTSPSSTSPDPMIEDDGKSRFSFSGALSSAAGLCACLNISEKEEDHQLYAPDAYAENSSSSADGRGITNNASDHHSKETRLNGDGRGSGRTVLYSTIDNQPTSSGVGKNYGETVVYSTNNQPTSSGVARNSGYSAVYFKNRQPSSPRDNAVHWQNGPSSFWQQQAVRSRNERQHYYMNDDQYF